jgi:hypothetical protein
MCTEPWNWSRARLRCLGIISTVVLHLVCLQVGRFDDAEDAARSRDLAVLALGNALQPKLNFDADRYTHMMVELMVSAGCGPLVTAWLEKQNHLLSILAVLSLLLSAL